ncbi:MAG: tetratricopeptide repeat protein, partial [Lachnospiraceae bacterium]|nr:tetratricopeptide repeat protein [Lachnospiraceae bacterium]
MNMDEIFAEIDRLYTANAGQKVEEFILEKLGEAARSSDENAMIQLLNELIGHYRETSEFDKMKVFAEKLLAILEGSSLKNSMAHATSLLNVANAYRAAGLLKESNALYQEVKTYYDANVEPDSMLYASLLNNMSLLFQEIGDFESAADCLERALGISLLFPECRIEQATTYANLAATLIKLGRLDEAEEHLERSFALFEADEEPDYHYSAALSAMGEIKYLKKEYKLSAGFYEKASEEIKKCVGTSRAYEITRQNMENARAKLEAEESAKSQDPQRISGLELARRYYMEYGKPMIHEKFPDYEDRIAAGLVGEGSECFGFDDGVSTDHDFGPGFCLWLKGKDYKKIGKELQKEYDALPKKFMGYERLETE